MGTPEQETSVSLHGCRSITGRGTLEALPLRGIGWGSHFETKWCPSDCLDTVETICWSGKTSARRFMKNPGIRWTPPRNYPTDTPGEETMTIRTAPVMHYLYRVAALPGDEASDAQLLEHFVRRRDEAAFAAILRRHGPMVLSVCRRVLGHDADAEDAFQATFLVLVRQASSVIRRNSLASWLYGVAHNTALKAKAMNSKRRIKEREAARLRSEPVAAGPDGLEALLDGELSRLPEHYRQAVVLCDLEGRTVGDAARQLGCPQGTVASRLARGRALLARRLARLGVGLSGAALTAALT